MKLEDGSEISTEQIELLNANGPYTMAIWRSGEVSVGNEEGKVGRSEYFMKLIRQLILNNFTLEELIFFQYFILVAMMGGLYMRLLDSISIVKSRKGIRTCKGEHSKSFHRNGV